MSKHLSFLFASILAVTLVSLTLVGCDSQDADDGSILEGTYAGSVHQAVSGPSIDSLFVSLRLHLQRDETPPNVATVSIARYPQGYTGVEGEPDVSVFVHQKIDEQDYTSEIEFSLVLDSKITDAFGEEQLSFQGALNENRSRITGTVRFRTSEDSQFSLPLTMERQATPHNLSGD